MKTGAKRELNRRRFLGHSIRSSAAISLPWIVSSNDALGHDSNVAPSEKITLGVIGIGPRCVYDLNSMLALPDVQCLAISDVQASRRQAGKELVDKHNGNRDCAVYRDFREMLARDDIDAVLIATGDRWHAPASIMAAEAGKDVYCEKPCGLTIADCQRLDDAMRRTRRIFQAGTQRRSVPNFQLAVELAHRGKLGKLQTLHASVYTPKLDNSWLSAESTPARDIVDWNLWLGPAPWRSYNAKYVSGGWRGIFDFDSGARLLDWGAHTVDLCQWANQKDNEMPIEYEPSVTGITCFYANGVKLVLDFLKTPFGDRGPNWITRLGTCPVRFVGDAGSVETGDEGEIEVSNNALKSEIPAAVRRVKGLDVSAHSRNFIDCIKSRRPTRANSQVMRHSHLACHAAALSWILNRKLKFDPTQESFIGDEEANSLRSRASRNAWN